MNKWVIILFVGVFSLSSYGQHIVKGRVVDKSTGQPLEFASIVVSEQKRGGVTDSNGHFTLALDKISVRDTLKVTFLGYEDVEVPLGNSKITDLDIKMPTTSYRIEEVVVKPMPPTYYIQKAVEAVENYPQKPYYIISYFANNFYENKTLLVASEAVFKTYYSNKSKDNNDIQPEQTHQLLLFRYKNSMQSLKFMSEELEKQKKKQEKQQKKGKQKEIQSQVNKKDTVVLRLEPLFFPINSDGLQFLDSKQFKNFKYEEKASCNQKNLRIINFESKKWFPMDDSSSINFASIKGNGTIYIDCSSNAIAKVTLNAEVKVSFLIKAALFVMFKKLKINQIKLNASIEYKPIGAHWYPSSMSFIARGNAEKVNFFSKNEKALFEVFSTLSVNAIITENVTDIPKEKRFSFDKTNLQNDMGIRWEDVKKVQSSLYD